MKKKKTEKSGKPETKPELFKVFLHNDDRTTMEFVVFILRAIFDKSDEDAIKLMMQVHNDGVGIAGSYPLDIAHLKVAAVKMMAKAKEFPFKCTIETQEDEIVSMLAAKHQLPPGWIMAGSYPNDYDVGIDTSVSHSGTRSAFVQHAISSPRGFGTLMQQSSPNSYLQKRVRMKMWVKTEDVRGRVQPWMRVDGPGRHGQGMLAFDNACQRAIQGTTDWQEFVIVLDVPQESTNIAFGILLAGEGKLWMDDVSFEEVSAEIATTDCQCQTGGRRNPKNLNFEED